MAEANVINTDKELETEMGVIAGAGLPAATSTQQEVQDNELIKAGTGQVNLEGDTSLIAGTVSDPLRFSTTAPTAPEKLGQIGAIQDVSTGLKQLGDAPVATFTPEGDYITAPQGQVSAQSLATAATEELDPRATTQFQLGQLMSSLEEGKPLPPWASPGFRKVSAIMQARGLGSSSIASAAITQSLMESGVQIATADANKYSAIQLQNLNNKQQTALQNAATYAAMDKANLNARLQAAVQNAQAFLSIDLKNLDNEQKSNTLTYQSLVAGLFKDAAEENARQQFNAKNELQVEEFFAELGAQIETSNANRMATIEQFNVGQENAMLQYNTTLRDSREKFNATAQFAIEQSNAVWRRSINTANTATENENNRINVQNQYNATMTALNNLWQNYRDNASWNFQKGESQLNREHDLGVIALEFANTMALYEKELKAEMSKSAGKFFTNLIDDMLDEFLFDDDDDDDE